MVRVWTGLQEKAAAITGTRREIFSIISAQLDYMREGARDERMGGVNLGRGQSNITCASVPTAREGAWE